MTDHAEEQEMEAEALEAIFDSQFSRKSPSEWSITLFPTLDEENHVACQLDIELPTEYPESLPQLNITLLQGLAEATHKPILQQLAEETAAQNEGLPAIYAIAETIKDWLVAHNRPGLDDTSMHAQMMLRTQESEANAKVIAEDAFESHTQQDILTEAEKEEIEVNQRRQFGTPCTLENFLVWKERFEAELAASQEEDLQDDGKKGRLTGYQQFRGKTTDLEALERAAEEAENDPDTIIDEDDEMDEELFKDDVDLDDLDFEDDDDDDEYDEEEDDDEDVDI